jgi:hypothetical protein
MHCSTSIDVPHRVADLVQRVMDNYSGRHRFNKIQDISRKSSCVAYLSQVDVIIFRNPNKGLKGRSPGTKNTRSYASITISAPGENFVRDIADYISQQVPEFRRQRRRISQYNDVPKKIAE